MWQLIKRDVVDRVQPRQNNVSSTRRVTSINYGITENGINEITCRHFAREVTEEQQKYCLNVARAYINYPDNKTTKPFN